MLVDYKNNQYNYEKETGLVYKITTYSFDIGYLGAFNVFYNKFEDLQKHIGEELLKLNLFSPINVPDSHFYATWELFKKWDYGDDYDPYFDLKLSTLVPEETRLEVIAEAEKLLKKQEEEKKRKRLAAQKRKENEEKKERELYEKLKKKYEN